MAENKKTMELDVNLTFKIDLDMTEFNQKTIKVDDLQKEMTDYIESKLDKETIKNNVCELVQKIETLGFKNIRNIVGVHNQSALLSLARELTNPENLIKQ